ncbi:MAG: flagellin [Lachnospiraceae bacterium]|nr:flagellin [Lachnospiraceae bacterium]
MRINSNKTAFITYNSLNVNERLLANSSRKLASGFKINVAGDDPTGYAISGRMRQQLSDIERCMTNATTGKSLCETADAALSEIDSIVQRLNELAVKAANGSLKDTDRQTIQEEADQLTREIKRISNTAELNSQKIFDGTFVNKGYTDNKDVQVVRYSDKTEIKTYTGVQLNETVAGDKITIECQGFPDGATTTMTFDYPKYVDEELDTDPDKQKVYEGVYTDDSGKGTLKVAEDGSHYITINGENGESITFKLSNSAVGGSNTFDCTLTGQGAMRIQVGPNIEEYISMELPDMSLTSLDFDGLYMTTQEGAQAAIDKVKYALSYVTSARSKIGAYQNRIEQSLSYLDASNENLTQTYSRILDTDMAEEMVNYTNSQILVQAATSILAQANKEPQQALELLQ